MRRFLRHPSDMPVELVLRRQANIPRQRLHNISLGGVACNSSRAFRRGTSVELRITLFGEQARDLRIPGGHSTTLSGRGIQERAR